MWGRVVKIALSLPFLIVAGLFGLYLVFGFFLINPLAQKLLPWIGENKLASQLSVQQITFNPLTLEATVDGLKLAEMSGAPLAGFDHLYVNLGTAGLFRWAWRIQDIQLERPRATIEVRRGGKLNWAALIDKLNEDKEPPSDNIPRVLIDHIRIADGDIDYADANRTGKPFEVSLQPLGIELDGLSTLPEDRGDYLIAAKLPEQGGTLRWKGEVGLNPVVSTGEVQLEGVKLERLIRVVKKVELPIKSTQGDIQAGLAYQFAIVDDKPRAVLTRVRLALDSFAVVPAQGSGTLTMKHFDLALPRLDFSMQSGTQVKFAKLALGVQGVRLAIGEAPLFQLPRAAITGVDFDLMARRARVAQVALTGGEGELTRMPDGSFDWSSAWKPTAEAAPEPAAQSAAKAGKPFAFEVAEVSLQDWRARLLDRSFLQPMRLEIADLDLRLAVSNLQGPLKISGFNSEISGLKMTSALQTEPAATLARLQVKGGEFDLDARAATVQEVLLSGLRTQVVRTVGQPLNWQAMLKQARVAPPVSERAVVKLAAGAERNWTLALQRLALEDAGVHVEDRDSRAPVLLDIERGLLEAREVTLDMARAIPLKASFQVRQGGRFEAAGRVIPKQSSGKLDLKLVGLSLKPFAPYVNRFARLNLRSGAASTRGKLAFAQAKSGMKLDYDGGFAIDDLAITEEETEEAFLGWKKLGSDNIEFSVGPDHLHIDELVATNPFGKIIIFEDKTINFKRILRSNGATAPEAGAADTQAPKPAAAPEAAPPAFPLDISRLRVVGANVEFADLSLSPQFGTRMHDLSGVVTGLSTDAQTTAQVELDGKVDDFGSARVRGSVQPFRATDFTDLTLTFRNLEMANLTPYSGKFAGRRIDSGKLSVDLEYKIKQRQLAGENKFVINKLKLGERVDSPDATKLPLDLAIALLEDSNGVIDLDLPISGSLDDPQFSYGKIIWKAIVNVLTKLVTAPFRALGKLLGVSSEKLEAVTFDPGSSKLLPPEQEKLKMLAEAMAKRPALTLTLEPGYDPGVDRRALQEQAIRREVATGTGTKFAPNEEPGPVDVNNFKVQTWLEDRYAERVGKEAYQKLRTSYKEKEKGGANPVMDSQLVERLGRRFKARDTGPVSAFHTELLEQLTQKTVIDDAALTKLAQERGQAMRETLLKSGLDGGRVSVSAPVEQAAKDKQVGSKMSLGAGKAVVSLPTTAPAAAVP